MSKEPNPIRVFVFLGDGFGADSWRERFTRHEIPGLNEQLPYGYYHAAGNGWNIEYSQDRKENRFVKLARRMLARLLGFDLVHAWRNRKKLEAADFVWTHTEREHLAVLLIFWLSKPNHVPKVIAQCVWLFDRWTAFSTLRRRFYSQLLKGADIITTQSPEDLAAAKRLFPDTRCELVLSGAAVEDLVAPRRATIHRPVRLAALGNDMHRDWETLIQTFGKAEEAFQLKIASTKFNTRMVADYPNVSVVKPTTEREIKEIYAWADIVIVPLKFNLHVSGITVVFEAIVSGRPVICTDTGGMRAYFSDDEVFYVSLRSPAKLREAVRCLASDDDLRFQLVANSQRKLLASALTKQGYAQRHRELSESLLKHGTARKGREGIEARPATDSAGDQKVKVFVHLGHGFGAANWSERHRRGQIPGFNEHLPYGFYLAAGDGWSMEYSQDTDEAYPVELYRRGVRRLLGFDFIHTWRNRERLLAADVVWTVSELEYLAVQLLLRTADRSNRPIVIGQCIWLFERWNRLNLIKRTLYHALLRRAAALVLLSEQSAKIAHEVVPETRVEFLPFGISWAEMRAPKSSVHFPIRVTSLGGDLARDWDTLIEAFSNRDGYELRIAPKTRKPRIPPGADNVHLVNAVTSQEVLDLYDWSDFVALSVEPNIYGSGSTVLLEAVVRGIPVICTDTVGLRSYFSDSEVRYVPAHSPEAWLRAADDLRTNNELRLSMARRAQQRLISADYSAKGYAQRYRKLTEEVLGYQFQGAGPTLPSQAAGSGELRVVD